MSTKVFDTKVKLVSFRSSPNIDSNVYQRIKSILKRIILLTVLYQIVFGLVIYSVIIIIYFDFTQASYISILIGLCLLSVSQTYSIYLMQQHNTNQYRKLLKILYLFQFHHICCCKSLIISGIEEENVISAESKPQADKHKYDSVYETADCSQYPERITVMELSVETTVVCSK